MSSIAGMTTNERLFEAGLLDAFDEAMRRRNRAAVIDCLARAQVADPEHVADTTLANPERYGF